ncbi:MAG: GDSL-type esterase/lipase family protein [Acidobacteriota bacterium]
MHRIRRILLLLAALVLFTPAILYLINWPNEHTFTAENRALANHPIDVVFLGDSITHRWPLPHPTWINRGINGDHALVMLLRYPNDVAALHPHTVVFLGGINDLKASNIPNHLRFLMPYEVEASIRLIALQARLHHQRLILCSLTPVDPSLAPSAIRVPPNQLRPDEILAVNRWLKAFAASHHLTYVDYYSVLTDGHDHLRPTLTSDGLHPNSSGYALMQPLIEKAINTNP